MLVCAGALRAVVSLLVPASVARPARADLGPPMPLTAGLLGQEPDLDTAVALSSDGETTLVWDLPAHAFANCVDPSDLVGEIAPAPGHLNAGAPSAPPHPGAAPRWR
jgi:hypothetical protein